MADVEVQDKVVTQDFLALNLNLMNERIAANERVTDAKLDRLEAMWDKNMEIMRAENKARMEQFDKRAAELDASFREKTAELDASFEEKTAELEKKFAKMEANNEVFRANVLVDLSEMRGDIKAMKSSIDALVNRKNWDIAWVSMAVAVGIALVQIFAK